MRPRLLALLVVLCATPLVAQEGGREYANQVYGVKAKAPLGWKKAFEEPQPAGAWLDLVQYTEEKSGAKATLSAQTTTYRSTEQMISGLTEQFNQAGSLVVLRREVKAAGPGRPKWILFEYTFKGRSGPEHSLVAYWFCQGRRYRVFGTVREVGWRTVAGDLERFAESVVFTGRAFSASQQNFTDEARNFAMYYPESWAIRLPESGPRVTFTSDRLGVAVWVYAGEARGDLAQEVARLVPRLKADKANVTEQKEPETHPTLGKDVVLLEYRRGEVMYRETILVHRDRLYRIILAAKTAAWQAGQEPYERMVGSIQFMK